MIAEMPTIAQELLSKIVLSLPSIAIGLTIFFIFWIAAKTTHSFIDRVADKNPPQRQPVFYILGTISKIAIIVIGLITALGSAGVNVSALVASIGLSGLAIGLASKDAFSNLLAGIMVLFYQPFKIGDIIEVGQLKGKVIKMSMRYTHLAAENAEILVPNSSLLINNIVIHKPNL
jgi:small-conductance mechanosensitive channel